MDPKAVAQEALNNEDLAHQIYDVLMAEIEPDLLLSNIPHLDEMYSNETPEQHDERMKRYEAAYQRFDAEFQNFMKDVHQEVRTSKRSALKEKEAEDRNAEEEQLSSLETAFGF